MDNGDYSKIWEIARYPLNFDFFQETTWGSVYIKKCLEAHKEFSSLVDSLSPEAREELSDYIDKKRGAFETQLKRFAEKYGVGLEEHGIKL